MRALATLPALAFVFLSSASVSAQTTLYELHSSSNYVVGCYEPCLCPISLFEDLTGNFQLTLIGPQPDGFVHYIVQNVAWNITTSQGTQLVTGGGTYQVGGQFALSQRLQLQLSIDNGAPQNFDSGIVLGGYSFPVIDAAVATNAFFCFNHVFDLNAAPLSIAPNYCTASPNSAGPGASIAAVGSSVVANNDFGLVAQGAPPNQFGLFFYGSNQAQLPLGDGTLCLGGTTVRLLPALNSDPDGNKFRTVDLPAANANGTLTPGSTWYFQYWFRDPIGGPAGFNLSDGVAVPFL